MKYEEILSDFQRLLLLRCFRVDRVYLAITHFVTKKMGEKYVTPPVLSFEGTSFDNNSLRLGYTLYCDCHLLMDVNE